MSEPMIAPDPKTVREIAREAMRRGGSDSSYGSIGSVISEHAAMDEVLASGDRAAFGRLHAAVRTELKGAAITVEWPDEQQPADVVTAEQQQDGVAEDVTAFLDAWEADRGFGNTIRGGNGDMPYLFATDLRAVLAERNQLRQLLGIGVDCEQWDAIAEAEGCRFEGEQTNGTLVGYLAYQRESSRALSGFLQSEVKELETERTALAARVAELESERDDDLCILAAFLLPNRRPIEEWLCILANHFEARTNALMRDADRFAAARFRVDRVPTAAETEES